MSVTHTPGPWVIEEGHIQRDSGGIRYWQVTDGQDAIACNQFCCADNSEANARLIAAAPDLLEALHTLVNYEGHGVWCGHGNDWDRPCVCGLNKAHDRARAAIAKAKGGAA